MIMMMILKILMIMIMLKRSICMIQAHLRKKKQVKNYSWVPMMKAIRILLSQIRRNNNKI